MSLVDSHPELVLEWHPSKNAGRSPENLKAGSNNKVWWLGVCGHEWESRVYSRSRGAGCPYCRPGGRVFPGENDLEALHPEIASQWAYDLNKGRLPSQFKPGSNAEAWWRCEKGHFWEARIQKRVAGQGCGVCRNLIFVPGVNDLEYLRPEIAAEWDYEKNLSDAKVKRKTPRECGPGTEHKVWWKCEFGHSWAANVDSRCNGRGCPVCSGRKFERGVNSLADRHPTLAAEFHPFKNGGLTPADIHGGQPVVYWWQGVCGHEWQALLTNRTSRDAGCPECAKTGYNSAQEGLLYLIHHPASGAGKVGITNPASKNNRLQQFTSKGWVVLATWQGDGRGILQTETKVLRWIRKDLGLPKFLGKEDLSVSNGASETFDLARSDARTIISKIDGLLAGELPDS